MPKITTKATLPKLSIEPDAQFRKLSQRTRYRITQIVRMTIEGMTDDEIALHLGYQDVSSIRVIRSTPEYKLIYGGIVSKHTTELDLQTATKVKELKEEIQCRIPEALRVYYDALKDSKLDNRLKAADKIIELDGRLGKKAEITATNQFFFSDSDITIGDSIVAAMRQSAGKPPVLEPVSKSVTSDEDDGA